MKKASYTCWKIQMKLKFPWHTIACLSLGLQGLLSAASAAFCQMGQPVDRGSSCCLLFMISKLQLCHSPNLLLLFKLEMQQLAK